MSTLYEQQEADAKRMASLFHLGIRNRAAIQKDLWCSDRKLYRLLEHPKFRQELKRLGYTGPIEFEKGKPGRKGRLA